MLGAARQGWQGSLLLLLLLFSSGLWESTSGINPPALSYTCGGNCPTATCQSYCPCGDYPSYIDSLTLQGYLYTYSLNEAVFVCIAETNELNANTVAQGINGTFTAGLFAESDTNSQGYQAWDLCDPENATIAAQALYQQCGFCPWISNPCIDTSCCGSNTCNSSCILPQFQNNATFLAVQANFVGQVPTVNVVPIDFVNGSFLIQPEMINEIAANGSVVKSVLIPDSGYTVAYSADAYDNQQITFSIVTSSMDLTMTYTLSSSDPNPLTLAVTLKSWTFQYPTDTLAMHILLTVTPPVMNFMQTNATTDNNYTTIFTFTSPDVEMTSMVILNGQGLVDGTTVTPVVISLLEIPSASTNGTSTVYDLILEFPHFNTEFYYDPEFIVSAFGPPIFTFVSGSPENLYALFALFGLLVIPLLAFFLAMGFYFHHRDKIKAREEAMAGEDGIELTG